MGLATLSLMLFHDTPNSVIKLLGLFKHKKPRSKQAYNVDRLLKLFYFVERRVAIN